ncbi:adenosine monophosphate-protein transferase, partial [Bartonella tribocorum]
MPKVKKPSSKHYIYPGRVTLKNKYEIKTLKKFREKCAHDTTKEMINLREAPLPEQFNSSYLYSIHHKLFKNAFEWAGHPRHIPFTFEDGTTAVMPNMQARGFFNRSFAIGDEISKGLQVFDQTLTEKDNLQGLTREEFNLEAVNLFNSLNYIRPFIEGNRRTQRVFFEKLAQAAGHQLDFSLITQDRMDLVNYAGAVKGDLEPMKHLFEDISNPEKIDLLREFLDNMGNKGYNMNPHPVLVAKEGETYTGQYRDTGFHSFAINMNGAYIIGNKDHLTPEQLKTLKPGDKFTFTVPQTQELNKTLIPKETLPTLKKTELSQLTAEDARVHKSREEIQQLSKIVYG